jgi:hypothetical protein
MSDGFFGESSSRSAVDVGAFLDSDIPRLIADIVSLGCLVSIGVTRDGGAVSIAVTDDGKRARSYFTDSSDGVDWLKRGLDTLRDGSGDPPSGKPARVQRPPRGGSKAT